MEPLKPYRCQERKLTESVALVVDSPHSGGLLPADMGWQGDLRLLLVNEDVGVDTLFADVPLQGIALLTAAISRHYIDLNRALDDLDPQVIADARGAATGHETGGLIRPLPGQRARLSMVEVERRINAVWWPYHRCLARLLKERQQRFGAVWHINAHSMPAGTRDAKGRLVDIVLGDRQGTTASPEFVAVLTELCRKEGFAVGYNDPYGGVECVRRHGQPARGQHSVQLEIGRQLFYDEEKFRFLPQMESFRVVLNRIMHKAVAYTRTTARPHNPLAAE